MKGLKKRSGSLWPVKVLLFLFMLVLIAYGVMAVIYGLEESVFKVPASPGIARLYHWLA